MNRSKRKQFLKQANLLDLKPLRIYDNEIDASGKISVLVPKFKSSFLSRVLIPKSKSKYIKVRLDENGSNVWQLIDGHKTVNEICNHIAKPELETNVDLEKRIHQFILSLYDQSFISFKELNI